MAEAQPADEIIEAFNDLLRLAGDEVDALSRAAWKLQGLFARNSGRFDAGLGLLHARTMLGQRDAADVLSNELWGRRFAIEPQLRLPFAAFESELGHYERGLELGSIPDEELTLFERQDKRDRLSICALMLGDLDQVQELTQDRSGAVACFADEAAEIGLLSSFADRQKLVNEAVASVQCGSDYSIGTDGHLSTIMIRRIYVAGDRVIRDALAARLMDKLEAFYRARSIDPSDASWLASELFLPVTARPPIERNAVLAMA